jgi:hypothetical protein
MKRYTILGTTDEHTSCDCCGRSDLKSTVAMRDNETDKDVFFGVVCAAHMRGVTSKEIKSKAQAADRERARVEHNARRDAFNREYAAFQSFLDSVVPSHTGNRHKQLETLGGYGTAKAMQQAAVQQ